jgi:hypothetical protein
MKLSQPSSPQQKLNSKKILQQQKKKMTMNNVMNRMLLILSALLLSTYLIGCGSGGSDNMAGIDGSGAPITSTNGTINGFGSVIVNGVHYRSDKAKILINGQLLSEDSLHTGYHVKVTSVLNTDGTNDATTIEFRPNLVGNISQIDLQKEQLVVLGQTVQITNTTVFSAAINPNYINGLKPNDLILVSGLVDSNNRVTATRIELAPLNSQQIMGYVSNLNLTNFTFTLNQLTVNYNIAELTEFANNQLKNGLLVNAIGTLNNQGIFQAKNITQVHTAFASDIKNANVEGFITRYVSNSDFDIDGISCSTNNQTLYENGNQTNLMLGSPVKITGAIDGAGRLIANRAEFHVSASNEIAGVVTSVSATTGATIMGAVTTGNFQIGDILIQTNTSTAYEDNSNDHLRRFNFSDIRAGNFLKVSGYTTDAAFVATKIARGRLDTEVAMELKYEGLITQVDSHSFTVLGHTVVTRNDTEIKNMLGERLSEEQFFALALNKKVRVLGLLKMGVFTASSIQLEL